MNDEVTQMDIEDTNRYIDMLIDQKSLNGMIIDRFQSQDLVRMLGVEFKD